MVYTFLFLGNQLSQYLSNINLKAQVIHAHYECMQISDQKFTL